MAEYHSREAVQRDFTPNSRHSPPREISSLNDEIIDWNRDWAIIRTGYGKAGCHLGPRRMDALDRQTAPPRVP